MPREVILPRMSTLQVEYAEISQLFSLIIFFYGIYVLNFCKMLNLSMIATGGVWVYFCYILKIFLALVKSYFSFALRLA